MDGGVWERVSSSFAQHSREDAWRVGQVRETGGQGDRDGRTGRWNS